jgi:hypothetical protein
MCWRFDSKREHIKVSDSTEVFKAEYLGGDYPHCTRVNRIVWLLDTQHRVSAIGALEQVLPALPCYVIIE